MPLTKFFLEKHSKALGYEKPPNISKDAFDLLMHYDWPGNVRELENNIERAIIQSMGDTLFPHHLGPSILAIREQDSGSAGFDFSGKTLPQIIAEVEKSAITEALDNHNNNLSEVAKKLDIGRSTLYRKLEQYGIAPENMEEES